jgi:hypothetical protein
LDGAVGVVPDDLAEIVDPGRNGVGARWIIEGGEGAAVIEEAVRVAAGVGVTPDDLAEVVDGKCLGAIGPQRIVEGGVVAVVDESVVHASDEIIPDDQSRVVDAVGEGATRTRQGIIERGEGAPAVKEAVSPGCGVRGVVDTRVISDDLAHIVDALREGADEIAGGHSQPIVDGAIGAILTAVEEAVVGDGGRVDGCAGERSNDLARVVDALPARASANFGAVRGRIVEGGDGVDGHDVLPSQPYPKVVAPSAPTRKAAKEQFMLSY